MPSLSLGLGAPWSSDHTNSALLENIFPSVGVGMTQFQFHPVTLAFIFKKKNQKNTTRMSCLANSLYLSSFWVHYHCTSDCVFPNGWIKESLSKNTFYFQIKMKN